MEAFSLKIYPFLRGLYFVQYKNYREYFLKDNLLKLAHIDATT
jgi:hypothetical protein